MSRGGSTLAIRVTAEQLADICMCLDYCIGLHLEEQPIIWETAKELDKAGRLAERLRRMLR
jgi:hypothetical protein